MKLPVLTSVAGSTVPHQVALAAKAGAAFGVSVSYRCSLPLARGILPTEASLRALRRRLDVALMRIDVLPTSVTARVRGQRGRSLDLVVEGVVLKP